MLTCREVARRAAGGEMEGAGWMSRLAARLHLMMCRHCRRYVEQLRRIGAEARRGLATEPGDAARLGRIEEDLRACIDRSDDATAGEDT